MRKFQGGIIGFAFAIAVMALARWVSPPAAHAGFQQPNACNLQFNYDSASIQTLQVSPAAGAGSSPIFVCGFDTTAAAAQTVQLVYGTGSNCGTGTQNLTPAFNIAAGPASKIGGPFYNGLFVPNGNQLCVKTTVATSTQVVVYAALQ